MNCKKALKHICENLDEDIKSDKCLEIKNHLDHCPDCKIYLDTLKKTVVLYKTYLNQPESLSHKKLLHNIKIKDNKT